MIAEAIKERLSARPFRRFAIVMENGKAIDVLDPEFAWMMPGNRMVQHCSS